MVVAQFLPHRKKNITTGTPCSGAPIHSGCKSNLANIFIHSMQPTFLHR